MYRTRNSILSIEDRGDDNQYKEAKEARKARTAREDAEKIRGQKIKLRGKEQSDESQEKLENGALRRDEPLKFSSGEGMIHHLVWMAPRQQSCLSVRPSLADSWASPMETP